MKGLILKDLYNIKNYVRTIFFILLIMSVLVIKDNMISFLYIFYSSFICVKLISSTFSLDEYCGWNKYCLITPVSRKQIVLSKFITMGIFSLSGLILSTFIEIIIKVSFYKISIDSIINIIVLFIVSFLASLFFGSIVILFTYKMGTEKSRLYVNFIFFIILAIFAIFISMIGLNIMSLIIIISLIILTYILFNICCKVYNKLEI